MLGLNKYQSYVIALVAAGVSIGFLSPVLGSVFFWGGLLFLYAVSVLSGRQADQLIILSCALISSAVFQGHIPVGYRLWHYVAILTLLMLTWSFRKKQNSTTSYILLLCILMAYMLLRHFVGESSGFELRNQLRNLMVSFSCLFLAYYAVRRISPVQRDLYLRQFFDFTSYYIGITLIGVLLGSAGEGRLGSDQGMDSNGIGGMAVAAVVSIIASWNLGSFRFKRDWVLKKAIYFSVAVIALLAILFTASRSTLFLLTCVILVPVFFGKISVGKKVLYISSCILIVVFLLVVGPAERTSYFSKRVNRSTSELKADRLEHLYLAYKMVEKRPVFGCGPGGFKKEYNEFKYNIKSGQSHTSVAPHNIFAMYLADYGALGLGILILIFTKNIGLTRSLKGPLKVIAGMAFVLLIIRALSGVYLDYFAMVCLGLVLGANQYGRKRYLTLPANKAVGDHSAHGG